MERERKKKNGTVVVGRMFLLLLKKSTLLHLTHHATLDVEGHEVTGDSTSKKFSDAQISNSIKIYKCSLYRENMSRNYFWGPSRIYRVFGGPYHTYLSFCISYFSIISCKEKKKNITELSNKILSINISFKKLVVDLLIESRFKSVMILRI